MYLGLLHKIENTCKHLKVTIYEIFCLNFFLIFKGLFFSGFCVELWQFYAAFGLQFLELAKYGVVRSLLSKCVHENETGKVFSVIGILAAVCPMIFNPVSRMIYNTSLETFPAAVILICASLMGLAAILNFLLFTQRQRIALFTSENNEKTNADPLIQTISLNDNNKSVQT